MTATYSNEEPPLSALLPLFPERAASLSVVKQGMGVIKTITDYLNPARASTGYCC